VAAIESFYLARVPRINAGSIPDYGQTFHNSVT
jgi:hypothetical protein